VILKNGIDESIPKPKLNKLSYVLCDMKLSCDYQNMEISVTVETKIAIAITIQQKADLVKD